MLYSSNVFNPLQIFFFKNFLGYKTIAFYTSWNETDLTWLLPFAFGVRGFNQCWKLLFKTLNRIKQTENT